MNKEQIETWLKQNGFSIFSDFASKRFEVRTEGLKLAKYAREIGLDAVFERGAVLVFFPK